MSTSSPSLPRRPLSLGPPRTSVADPPYERLKTAFFTPHHTIGVINWSAARDELGQGADSYPVFEICQLCQRCCSGLKEGH